PPKPQEIAPDTPLAPGAVARVTTSVTLRWKASKSDGTVVAPMDLITKFSSEALRYYFMRECPLPGDGDFSWERFATVYTSDLGKNLGNLLSRITTLLLNNFD